jgi:AraC family transcriptional regulator
MEPQIKTLIAQVIDYIENNIKSPIVLDDITEHVNLSKYYLHRLFRALTGFSLMAYVRARKLSLSLKELLYTDYSIIDIAYEYGFEYEQSYIRAFKSFFNMTPNYVRKYKPTLSYVEQIDLSHLTQLNSGVVFSPSFIMKPEFYLAGMKRAISYEENNRHFTANKTMVDFAYNHVSRINNVVNYDVFYGLVLYSDQPSVFHYYMPSVEVEKDTVVEEPFTYRAVPTGEYAVFKYIGLHRPEDLTIVELNEIYDYSLHWIANHERYELEAGYHFERVDLSVCSQDYCELEIYIPIRNKITSKGE